MEAAQPQAAGKAVTAVPTAVPKGTAFDPESARLSVLSYNLLAPIYVRPIDRRTGAVQAFAAFAWAEPAAEVLEWGVRWPRLLAARVTRWKWARRLQTRRRAAVTRRGRSAAAALALAAAARAL